MSDLKHRTPDELRDQIATCEKSRKRIESQWTWLEAEAERLKAEAAALRKKHHNIGQIEVWARIWLARKT